MRPPRCRAVRVIRECPVVASTLRRGRPNESINGSPYRLNHSFSFANAPLLDSIVLTFATPSENCRRCSTIPKSSLPLIAIAKNGWRCAGGWRVGIGRAARRAARSGRDVASHFL
eukprot:4694729-Prymnesium_polylepis.2